VKPAGPMALLAAAAALAVVGVGLLVPARDSAGEVTSPAVTDAAAGSPTASTLVTTAASVSPAPAPASPPDRLAGPVTDDEVARAFIQAVPAAEGIDPAVSAALIQAASDGLIGWYGEAGWRDIRMQAAVVTAADAAAADAAASEAAAASVTALWSGEHPVLGGSDRRLATVTLDAGPAPGPAWIVRTVEGGPADG